MMAIITIILIFLLIILSYVRTTVFTPKYAMEYKFPFLRPFSDNENYYLITSRKELKINIDTGDISESELQIQLQYSDKGVFCTNELNDCYIYDPDHLYYINHNKFIFFSDDNPDSCGDNLIGCISLDDNFIIYGMKSDRLVYIQKYNNEDIYHCHETSIPITERFSCKYIKNDKFICALIDHNEKIKIYLLNEQSDNNHLLEIIYDSKQYINIALYNTTIKKSIKILCGQLKDNDNKIMCCFFRIKYNNENTFSGGGIQLLGNHNLTFNSEDNKFNEKDCSFSEFNNEYLFCCGVKNFIICYRLNYMYEKIKQFNISIEGRNSYLSMITNNLNATFFFMNEDKKVYVYKIFLPNCTNKEYSFYYSLNENNNGETLEKLSNLFNVSANNTYLKFDNAPYNFGNFILNENQTITNSDKIHIKNNEYIFDFNITNRDIINSNNITINYTVIIENDEAYSKQCQIKFNFGVSSCGDNYIKYENNCYQISNSTIKSFYDPENNKESSCYQKFHLYIKEDSNECIKLSSEGYYISNNITGLLSKCYESCKTCAKYKEIYQDNKENHNCIECADNYYKLENELFPNNCYDRETINSWRYFEESTINSIFFPSFSFSSLISSNLKEREDLGFDGEEDEEEKDISETISTSYNIKTTEKFYENEESEKYTDKQEVSTEEKEELKFTTEKINEEIELSENNEYTYEKDDNYKNEKIPEENELPSSEEKKNTDEKEITLSENEISNSEIISECDISCLTCNVNNKTICSECNKENGYFPLYNNNSFCYNNETINEGYYLDKSTSSFIWKLCKDKCDECNMFKTQDGDCVTECPNDYIVYNNECISKINEQNILITEFKNKILSNISSYINSSKVINGTNFIATVLSSDNMEPEEQIKNGISAVELGNCTEVIKEYYNISKYENLIIFNIETKNSSNNNKDNSFNLGKNTQIEIYDILGNKLNLSVCKEDITVMKYIGDVEELDIQSAMSLSEQGIDVFNSKDKFFNDICHPYENSDGRDITINDRRKDIYQNATFCQNGCSYLGMNYNLMVANCKCDSSVLQGDENSITNNDKSESNVNYFESLTKSFIANLLDFNYEIIRCYNLVFKLEILKHNIGFFCLFIMFLLQLIFFIIYLIRKVKQIKIFMLIFNDKYEMKKIVKKCNKTNSAPPKKRTRAKRKSLDKRNRIINKNHDKNIKKYIDKNKDNIHLKGNESNDQTFSGKKIINKENKLRNILQNDKKYNKILYSNNLKKEYFISNNNSQIINAPVPMININNRDFRKGINYNLSGENNLTTSKTTHTNEKILKHKKIQIKNKSLRKKRIKHFKHKMDTIPDKMDDINNKYKVNKLRVSKFLKNDDEVQDMDYEEAIIHDKRNYLRIFWSFLIDSQIILGTFCTGNYLNLFVIKLSFFIFTFQISFFLNALFYTDDYISDAYHNNGVLDFISGLPKSIYSFIATLITINLLKMLSNSKSELTRVIRMRGIYNNFRNIINMKLWKLRKKLIIYFIIVFLLEIFFLYYVTAFCAVYRNSQKYWFFGCLESFGMDSLVSFIICLFTAFLRYISVRKQIKYCFFLSNFISTFL